MGFPGFLGGLVVKRLLPVLETQRQGFSPWVGKTPWRRAPQPTPVFLPGESHGQRSLVATVHGVAKSRTQLSTCILTHTHIHTHPCVEALSEPLCVKRRSPNISPSAEVSLRWGLRRLSLWKLRQLKLKGQRNKEEGISQGKSSRDLHKVPFESLAKYAPST